MPLLSGDVVSWAIARKWRASRTLQLRACHGLFVIKSLFIPVLHRSRLRFEIVADDVRFGFKADMTASICDVRFIPDREVMIDNRI
jgi:hypothetical protein